MGEYAEYQLQYDMRRGVRGSFFSPVPKWPKVECPICGKMCGGRGDRKTDGVHQHLKFKHGVKRKWERENLLSQTT